MKAAALPGESLDERGWSGGIVAAALCKLERAWRKRMGWVVELEAGSATRETATTRANARLFDVWGQISLGVSVPPSKVSDELHIHVEWGASHVK
jgi:hypothetical protein